RSVWSGPSDSAKSLEKITPLSLQSFLQADVVPGARIPNLEVRLRLAYNLAITFFQLHSKGLLHRDVRSENIIFFAISDPPSTPTVPATSGSNFDFRSPFLASFDLFSESGA